MTIPLYVAEVMQPGDALDHPDNAWASNALLLIYGAYDALAEAAIALTSYEQSRKRRERDPTERSVYGVPVEDVPRLNQLKLEAAHALGTHVDDGLRYEEIRFHALVAYWREQWRNGVAPESYEKRRPFIYARAFVYSVDQLAKYLGKLRDLPGTPAGVSAKVDKFKALFPGLRDIRNSIAHVEERSLGLTYGKPIALQPVPELVAGGGTILAADVLIGDRYGVTAGDGKFKSIEVSPASLEAARQLVIDVINCLPWRGRPEQVPGD